jgi:hypothetical protein
MKQRQGDAMVKNSAGQGIQEQASAFDLQGLSETEVADRRTRGLSNRMSA